MEEKHEQNTDIENMDETFSFNPNYQYRIRKNDKISISVWGQDELSVGSVYGIYNSNEVYGKWLMVDIEGNIEVPKIGTLKVQNMTVLELKKKLKIKFGEWIIYPIVDVKILNKEITVLGEVREPRVIQIDKDNNTLLEMITQCKGFEFYANLKYIKVLRQEGEHVRVANINLTKSGDLFSKNIQLFAGDVVIVPSKKYKEFDKRISNIIPFTTTITAAAIFKGIF
jgi:polysaccharide export outer membrane protein